MANFVCRQRQVPVTVRCDAAVIGGGPAGFAAAVSAARCGLNTVLIERLGSLGGTATLGYVLPISGFFQNGKRVAGGIAWELVERLEALGAALVEYPKGHVSFHPETWKLTAQRMALESGVQLMTNMALGDCVMDGQRVTHVILDGKSGPEAVEARCFIDATGDADLCRLAGAEMQPEGSLQPASLCFVLEGVDVTTPLLKDSIHHTGAGGSHSVNDTIHAYLDACVRNGELKQFGGPWFNTMVQGGTVSVNVTRQAGDGADRADLTRMECQLREDMFTIVALLRREYPEFRNCSIVASGVNAGIRETRRIRGIDTVTGQDMLSGRLWPCPVARCAHPMDIHDARTSAQTVDYYSSAAYIPHTALIPRGVDSVLAVGRGISADPLADASLRVQATMMAVGESAGLMAAELCRYDIIDPDRLRKAIQERGIIPQ